MLPLYTYSPFLKLSEKDIPHYLLLMRFTLAEGALLLLDTGTFLVDAFTWNTHYSPNQLLHYHVSWVHNKCFHKKRLAQQAPFYGTRVQKQTPYKFLWLSPFARHFRKQYLFWSPPQSILERYIIIGIASESSLYLGNKVITKSSSLPLQFLD